MIIGRVVGNATSTVKHASLRGWKLLVVQPLHVATREPDGYPFVAVDPLGAGVGQEVLLSSDGKSVTELMRSTTSPVRWSVVGLTDKHYIQSGMPTLNEDKNAIISPADV